MHLVCTVRCSLGAIDLGAIDQRVSCDDRLTRFKSLGSATVAVEFVGCCFSTDNMIDGILGELEEALRTEAVAAMAVYENGKWFDRLARKQPTLAAFYA